LPGLRPCSFYTRPENKQVMPKHRSASAALSLLDEITHAYANFRMTSRISQLKNAGLWASTRIMFICMLRIVQVAKILKKSFNLVWRQDCMGMTREEIDDIQLKTAMRT
jgi:hypothetical protein